MITMIINSNRNQIKYIYIKGESATACPLCFLLLKNFLYPFLSFNKNLPVHLARVNVLLYSL